MSTDLGILRSITRLADDRGFFSVVALDHPATMVLGRAVPDPTPDDDYRAVVEVKLAYLRALAAHASAVLLDPEMALPAAVATGALPSSTGLVLNIEAESYQVVADARRTTDLRAGWTPAKIRAAGGDALKLLWRYRSEVPEAAAHRDVVRRLRRECDAVSLPLIVEPIWVPLPGEDLADPQVRDRRARAVVDDAHLAAELGADIVKTEFPGTVSSADERDRGAQACAELDAGLDVPWLLLSAGVTFEQFLTQTELAARAGASGFIAGRAVWDCAVHPEPAQRERGLEVALDRLDRLTAVTRAFGRPWRARADVDEVLVHYARDWYVAWHVLPVMEEE